MRRRAACDWEGGNLSEIALVDLISGEIVKGAMHHGHAKAGAIKKMTSPQESQAVFLFHLDSFGCFFASKFDDQVAMLLDFVLYLLFAVCSRVATT